MKQFRSFNVQVMARDNGSLAPDQQRNPVRLHKYFYPTPGISSPMTELIPKSASGGSLVVEEPGLFVIGYTAERSESQRDVSEQDSTKQNLIVAVKGQRTTPSFSHLLHENKPGFVIGNIGKDLGLDVKRLSSRKARIDSEGSRKRYCDMNSRGELVVAERIDREELCGDKILCILRFELVLEGPLEMHHVSLEIRISMITHRHSPRTNSTLTSYLIIALVSVSTFFLTFIIIILGLRFCRRRKPRLLFDGAVAIPSSYLPPNYADMDCTGTLRSAYNYDGYLTTGSRTSDFKFELPAYEIQITAKDGLGSASSCTLLIDIIDVNDNAPITFIKSLTNPIPENLAAGVPSGDVNSIPVTAYLSVNGETGVIQAQRSFDYEQMRSFKVLVMARDNGSPPLSSNVTVTIFVTDVNDNPPQILYPAQEGSSLMTELVPKTAHGGSLVSKVIAVDADSGQNAWLSYHIIKSTDPELFAIGVHSGELKTQRDISESDSMRQNLVVAVRDNGSPVLSATCTMILLVSDNLADVPELKDMSFVENNSKLTTYLVVALVSISTFFLTFIIVSLGLRFCRRRKPRMLFDGAVAIPSAYLPPNYADVDGSGTLRSTYNYDAYLTTGSRTSDFKFARSYNDNTLLADQTLVKRPIDFDEAFGDAEGNPEHTNGDLAYSIEEEMKPGSVIGNIAKDLGLEVGRLSTRKARIETDGNDRRYCDVNLRSGDLIVAERMDREKICAAKPLCLIKFALPLEAPLGIASYHTARFRRT
ncbi:hypothetical protein CRUP_009006 [Coryphaenoides rupestris]|nr:hypothetical protein CRUP_009006 [Coryphaenoides rupestris]